MPRAQSHKHSCYRSHSDGGGCGKLYILRTLCTLCILCADRGTAALSHILLRAQRAPLFLRRVRQLHKEWLRR